MRGVEGIEQIYASPIRRIERQYISGVEGLILALMSVAILITVQL